MAAGRSSFSASVAAGPVGGTIGGRRLSALCPRPRALLDHLARAPAVRREPAVDRVLVACGVRLDRAAEVLGGFVVTKRAMGARHGVPAGRAVPRA
jgi:hypothetical protein